MRRELLADDMIRMMVPSRFWKVECSEISTNTIHGTSDSAQSIARKYMDRIDVNMAKGYGLLLWGDNGCGKTCMSVVIAKEARRHGHTVMFAEAADMKRSVIEREMFDEDQTMWDRARGADLLVLDDLGKGTQDRTGFGARLLDELIRHRAARQRPIIITTNMNPGKQLGEELKQSTFHALKECVLPVHVVGLDRRESAKAEMRKNILG